LLDDEDGRSKVVEIINSRHDYLTKNEEWSLMMNYIRKMNYVPTRCDTYCPFANECFHALNMVEQGKLSRGSVQVIQEPQFQDINEVYNKLEKVFEDILKSTNQGVYVIKDHTRIEKTDAIVNIEAKNKFSNAFTTHKLKEQVSQRLNAKKIKHFKVPELPVLDK